MDVAFLSRRTFKNNIFSARTNHPVKTQKEISICQHIGFFYIGKNPGNSEVLIHAFDIGSSFDLLDDARETLLSITQSEDGIILPEVIFCGPKLPVRSVRILLEFLQSHTEFSEIPLILDASGLSERELNEHRKNKFFDEIIFLDESDSTKLQSKVRFLKKIKSGSIQHSEEPAKDGSQVVQNILKRIFDIIVSALALIVLSPLMLMIALAIKAESGDPVFYISKRAGKGYRIFYFFKFRTMHIGAEEKIAQFAHLNVYGSSKRGAGGVFTKIVNDPRITRVGSFLRKTSLDELPQLVNVLLGDMSLVGNRPLPLYEAETLTTDEWAKRFMAPAGITGLWQVKKRGQEDMSSEERISLDIEYAGHHNFMYDLKIMARTPAALIQNAIC